MPCRETCGGGSAVLPPVSAAAFTKKLHLQRLSTGGEAARRLSRVGIREIDAVAKHSICRWAFPCGNGGNQERLWCPAWLGFSCAGTGDVPSVPVYFIIKNNELEWRTISAHCFLRLCYRKWLMLFFLKFQRINR